MDSGQLEFDFPPPKLAALLTVDEIFDRMDQSVLEAFKEDKRIERKPASFHGESLAEYVSMWANTPPAGGLIALGVHDKGQLLGCRSLSQDQLNRADQVQDLCPGAKCEVKRVPVVLADGTPDFVIVIRVHYLPNRIAKTPKGEVYARLGDERRRLKYEEIRHLQSDKGEIAFEQEPCGLSYPKDFDLAAIKVFAQSVREMCGITTHPSDDEILASKHLATRNDDGTIVPNMACALLFAKEPDRLIPGCKIRFFRFDGDHEYSGERRNVVKELWVEGTVPTLIQGIEEILDSQIRAFSALGTDGRFYSAPEYPKFAWYEAVVNACVHRAYGNGLRNMMLFVKMFDSRLEIESPGPFPPFVTPANIIGNSHPRNPKLMHAMYFMRFVKMAGEGTRRIRDTMRAASLPEPDFSEKQLDHSRVRVTLRNNIQQRRQWVDQDAVAIVGAAIAASLNEDEKRILNHVAENGTINVTQAVRATQLAWETAKKVLTSLVDRNILEHIHSENIIRDPNAHYRLRQINKGTSQPKGNR